jgi:TolA-binding protein
MPTNAELAQLLARLEARDAERTKALEALTARVVGLEAQLATADGRVETLEGALGGQLTALQVRLTSDVLELHRRLGEQPAAALQRGALEGIADVHRLVVGLQHRLDAIATGPSVAPRVSPTVAEAAPTPVQPPAPAPSNAQPANNGWSVVGQAGVTAGGQQPNGPVQTPPGVVNGVVGPVGGGWNVQPPPGAAN